MSAPPLFALDREVYTVSRLNREVGLLLTQSLPPLWVEGELSNVARPSSGHLYFSLKDEAAQVRCAMFRHRCQHLSFLPADGTRVLARVRIGLYEPRGEFQLVVEHLEDAGLGALARAFALLKTRLAAEGLFDASCKRPLPALPRQIGVITSPTGAAVRDILSVLKRRFPLIPVVIYPASVQGEGAPEALCKALAIAGERGDCEVLILARGGGAIEDLAAFNDEALARAIAACPIPLVTGIGHEIDFTIADFVADLRAPTPTAAAERVSPDQDVLRAHLAKALQRLIGGLARTLKDHLQRMRWLNGRLGLCHPQRHLQQLSRRLDDLELRARQAIRLRVIASVRGIEQQSARLRHASPAPSVQQAQGRLKQLELALYTVLRQHLQIAQGRLAGLANTLDATSPLATLKRGYALVMRQTDHRIVRTQHDVTPGEAITIRLGQGTLNATVTARHSPVKPR